MPNSGGAAYSFVCDPCSLRRGIGEEEVEFAFMNEISQILPHTDALTNDWRQGVSDALVPREIAARDRFLQNGGRTCTEILLRYTKQVVSVVPAQFLHIKDLHKS